MRCPRSPCPKSYAAAEAAAQTYFYRHEDQDGTRSVIARFALRGMFVLGAWL